MSLKKDIGVQHSIRQYAVAKYGLHVTTGRVGDQPPARSRKKMQLKSRRERKGQCWNSLVMHALLCCQDLMLTYIVERGNITSYVWVVAL